MDFTINMTINHNGENKEVVVNYGTFAGNIDYVEVVLWGVEILDYDRPYVLSKIRSQILKSI